jgi:hypothetical protein
MNKNNLPPTHISDDALNQYLDQALPAGTTREVETHLESCSGCSMRLAELQALFDALDSLPDAPLLGDLTPGVLTAIQARERRTPALGWWLLVEGALALVILFASLPRILQGSSPLQALRQAITELTLNLRSVQQVGLSIAETARGIPSQLLEVVPANLPLQLSTISVLWLLGISASVWLIGNAVLFRPGRQRA